MAYDDELADRVRGLLTVESGLTERRMFGGLAFLLGGNLVVAASGQGGLLLRIDPVRTTDLVSPPVVDRAVMRGTALDGWLRVDPEAVATDHDLARWIALGVQYSRSLAPE